MFKIEAICDDKRVGDALRALVGIVRGQPTATPMVNVEPGPNGSVQAATNGEIVEMFAKHLAKTKTATLTPTDFREWLVSIGKAGNSGTHYVNKAIAAGIIRRTGKSTKTKYIVRK